ncbi:MAG: hypothetical protein FD123_942 [Bacteroidetes bacterium]|nr:MAG: hypothetical protein FD123_942 [Bacteroidota bacterium]
MVPYIALSTLLFRTDLPDDPAEFAVLLREAKKRWLAELELNGGASVEVNGISRTKNDLLQALDECAQEDRLLLHKAIHSVYGLPAFLETGNSEGIAWDQLDYGQVTGKQKTEITRMLVDAYRERLRQCWNSEDTEAVNRLSEMTADAPAEILQEELRYTSEKEKLLVQSLNDDLEHYDNAGVVSEFLRKLSDEKTILFWVAFFSEVKDLAKIYCSYYDLMFRRRIPDVVLDKLVECARKARPLFGMQGWMVNELIFAHKNPKAGERGKPEPDPGYERPYKSNGLKIYQRIVLAVGLIAVIVMIMRSTDKSGSGGSSRFGRGWNTDQQKRLDEIMRQAQQWSKQRENFKQFEMAKPTATALFDVVRLSTGENDSSSAEYGRPETGDDPYRLQYSGGDAWVDSGTVFRVTNKSKYDAVLFISAGSTSKCVYIRAGEKFSLNVSLMRLAQMCISKGENWNSLDRHKVSGGENWGLYSVYSAQGGFTKIPHKEKAFDGLYYVHFSDGKLPAEVSITISNNSNTIKPAAVKMDVYQRDMIMRK